VLPPAVARVNVILAADFRRFMTAHDLLEPLLRHTIRRLREPRTSGSSWLPRGPSPARVCLVRCGRPAEPR